MQASAEPFRFRRKPAINNHQDLAIKQNFALQLPQKTKKLKFEKKIFDINVCLSSPEKERADQSLAYSISLTPITSSQKKNVQQNKMQEAIRYLYGTEGDNNKLEEINQKDENQEDSILLEYEQLLLNNDQPKVSFTPLTNCTNEGQSQKNIVLPFQISCSKFQLNSNHYKLSFVFLNEFVVKIVYSPSKGRQNFEALDPHSGIKLATRMSFPCFFQTLMKHTGLNKSKARKRQDKQFIPQNKLFCSRVYSLFIKPFLQKKSLETVLEFNQSRMTIMYIAYTFIMTFLFRSQFFQQYYRLKI